MTARFVVPVPGGAFVAGEALSAVAVAVRRAVAERAQLRLGVSAELAQLALELDGAVTAVRSDRGRSVADPVPMRAVGGEPAHDWLDTGTVAGRLGVTERQVRALVASGRLVGRQAAPGCSWRIEPTSVDAEEARRAGGRGEPNRAA